MDGFDDGSGAFLQHGADLFMEECACFDATGNKTAEVASMDGTGVCNTMYPPHSEPRLAAGAPLANDILKCTLKPINFAADYPGITFTRAQQGRLRTVFPTETSLRTSAF